jgi:N-acetylglucosaminyl-diphospho-decaprenol L-rhamnosyltransferase
VTTTSARPDAAAAAAPELGSLVAVIPNWGTLGHTIRCTEALIADGVPPERIVLVENGSGDDSAERLRERFPDAVVVTLEQNVGYGRAINAGARSLAGDSYLVLNNDAFVHRPGSVRELVRALDDASVGVAVPRLLNDDGTLQPSVMPISSPAVAFARASGLSRLVPNRWQPRWGTRWNHRSSRAIDAANGAVFLVRGKLWDQLGGFDERIFMYAEDLDLCWRARELGWRIWFAAGAEFVHLGKGSVARHWSDAARAEVIGRSESAMIRSHLSPRAARLTLAFMAGGVAARWAVHRALGRHAAAASLRGSLRGLSW